MTSIVLDTYLYTHGYRKINYKDMRIVTEEINTFFCEPSFERLYYRPTKGGIHFVLWEHGLFGDSAPS